MPYMVTMRWMTVALLAVAGCAHAPEPVEAGERLIRPPARITLKVQGAPIRQVIEHIAELAHITVLVHRDVEGTTSFAVRRMRWDVLLDAVVRTSGFGVVQDGPDRYRVVPFADR